jgi:redox-sensing transcriptional repressor
MSGNTGRSAHGALKRAVLERLARYHMCLRDVGLWPDAEFVSSAQIADHLGMNATQVRKDLALIGVRGRPHVGFDRAEMVGAIRSAVGLDSERRAVIVGAGRLGGAIAAYDGFREYGLHVVAFFDTDAAKIGSTAAGRPVYPPSYIARVVGEADADLAILTCPADAAQSAADELIAAGIRAIWNFAPAAIAVPESVAVRNEHISLGLAELLYHLKA